MSRFILFSLLIIWSCISLALGGPFERQAEECKDDDESVSRYDILAFNQTRKGYVRWGDMVVPDRFRSGIGTENAIPLDSQRWTNGIVRYIIDPSLKSQTSLIQRAMKHYESTTCIRFKKLSSPSGNYINFFKGDGCYSNIGMIGKKQDLSLGDGCEFMGTVVHEIGHALGFFHEQNRSDRDKYINVYCDNIEDGERSQFELLTPEENRLLTPFDYDGIMIYGEYAFSKEPGVLKTMEDKNQKHKLLDPYDKQGMTASDIKRVRTLYKC